MPTVTTSPPPPLSGKDAVYAKTAAGRAEVARRSLGLNSRQRTLLIMVDGSKASSELALTMPGSPVTQMLAELAALGLIDGRGTPEAAAPAPIADPLPSPHLADIKRQMADAAQSCLGLLAADLLRRLERASDEPQLLNVLGHWHMAMRDSKRGREVVEDYLQQIKASFQDGTAFDALTGSASRPSPESAPPKYSWPHPTPAAHTPAPVPPAGRAASSASAGRRS
jgi:hypothetical protein